MEPVFDQPREESRFVEELKSGRLTKWTRLMLVTPLINIAGPPLALTVLSDHAWVIVALIVLFNITTLTLGGILLKASEDSHKDSIDVSEEARRSRHQMQELFAMTDMLQAAEDHSDAGAILTATSERLLPQFGGALYIFNNSRDRLDLATSWNENEGFRPPSSLLPSNCWALKRGKPHINDRQVETLCCLHHQGEAATVEIPMMARGQVQGLMVLATNAPEKRYELLYGVRRMARALSDSMSLALSNIALRETLRTQSLRDPLTGLYNRRYMEDALERYISLAERSGAPTSVIMLDLDHFKRLNDEGGHAKGDAVLRDVAAQLVGAVRPSDVVSRFGGEELVIIMPNCDLQGAMEKAEILRDRIEALSEPHNAKVSASFGVASYPETSTASDIIAAADAAVYAAKDGGRNCVRSAEPRPGKHPEGAPLLAVG